MSLQSNDSAADGEPKPRSRFRRLRWADGLYILFAIGVGLGVFGVVIGEFWTVTAAGYLLGVSFLGFMVKSLADVLARPARIETDAPAPD